jgi:hypothetical protein
MAFLTDDVLEGVAAAARQSPADRGTVDLIVCRPAQGERLVLEEGMLDLAVGLVGDNWATRPSNSTPDRSPNPLGQVTLINSRVLGVIAGDDERRPLAGDQLHVDLDLSVENLPPGTRLAVGEAVLEVTEKPHNGCLKFEARYGRDVAQFVNSPRRQALRLRGMNARVVTPGRVRAGDAIVKLP